MDCKEMVEGDSDAILLYFFSFDIRNKTSTKVGIYQPTLWNRNLSSYPCPCNLEVGTLSSLPIFSHSTATFYIWISILNYVS